MVSSNGRYARHTCTHAQGSKDAHLMVNSFPVELFGLLFCSFYAVVQTFGFAFRKPFLFLRPPPQKSVHINILCGNRNRDIEMLSYGTPDRVAHCRLGAWHQCGASVRRSQRPLNRCLWHAHCVPPRDFHRLRAGVPHALQRSGPWLQVHQLLPRSENLVCSPESRASVLLSEHNTNVRPTRP